MQDTKLLKFLLTDLKKRGWEKEKATQLEVKIVELAEERDWRKFEKTKHETWQKLRAAYTQVAARLVETEYQSPSFKHSLWSEAGKREGQVYGNMNDYTRDQHPLAYNLEQSLKYTYQPCFRGVEAHVTVSGMAALTTILTALRRMGLGNGTLLVGKESYFQNREVILGWGGKVASFDELDLVALAKLIKKEKPRIIMVDSLSNTEKLVKPDLVTMQKLIRDNAKEKTYLLIDNSMVGVGVNYKNLWQVRGKCETIIWESLNKYFQYGMDHVTGGVVWARGILMNVEIFKARMHAGTILPDLSFAMFPKQSLMMMKIYQEQLARNKQLLFGILRQAGKKVRVAEGEGFGGVQIVVELSRSTPFKINQLIGRVIRRAKRRGVQISAGTSFGMPTTRIYLTARNTGYARMFIRVSVGWESEEAIREIGEVLKKCL